MKTKTVEEENSKLRFVVRLLIKHPNLDPGLISERLAMLPNMTQLVGTKRKTPKGVSIGGTYRESRWGWSIRVAGKRSFFDDVTDLANRLKPHKKFLSEIIDSGGTIEVIVHLPGDVNIGWTLDWQEMEKLAELQINLGIEVFPQFD